MGFDVPEPFCWDESFRVFYDNIDDEHKALFQAVFDVAGKNDAASLANLVSVTDNHFSDEEGMMVKAKYDNYSSHKKVHDEFLGKIKGLKAPVDAGTITFAKDWLVNHIKGIDFKYKGKL